MTAHVTIDQTADGWIVEATDADDVIVTTEGSSVLVAVHPDDDDTGKPLAVGLE